MQNKAKAYALLWPGGRRRALTFSWDDGVLQDRRLLEIMRGNGIRGTFNLNSGLLGSRDELTQHGVTVDHSHVPAEEIASLYAGQEIAAHTVNHASLPQLEDERILRQLRQDRDALEALAGYSVRGMAYPFGATDDRVQRLVRACGMVYARGTRVTGDFSLPENPLDWACSCRHRDLEPLIEPLLQEGNDLRLLSVWGHSYEMDQRNDWHILQSQMERLGGCDDIWYATNGEIFAYLNAFAKLDASGGKFHNASDMPLWLEIGGKTEVLPPEATLPYSADEGL